jgi:membrane-associated phospholipid phosphatase
MEKAFDSKFEGAIAGFEKPESWTLRIFFAVVSVVAIGMAFEVDPWVDGLVKSCQDAEFLGLAKAVSFLGDFLGVLSIGLLGWGGARWRKLPKLQTLFKAMICAAILSGVCANVCRCVAGRTRPNAQADAGWYGPGKGVGLREAHQFQAFPSAHTAVVAGFLAPVVIASSRRGSRLRAIGLSVVACGGIALMAWARVWLGAHHLSDVLAAVILGVSVAVAVCRNPDQRAG